MTQPIRVRDYMTTKPITVNSSISLEAAFDLMLKHGVRELPVVEHDELLAIVTDRDLREISPTYPLFRDQETIRGHVRRLKVADAMTPDPMVVGPDTSVVDAAQLLVTYKIGSVPVVEKGKLVGILSVTDLLRLFIEQNGPASDI